MSEKDTIGMTTPRVPSIEDLTQEIIECDHYASVFWLVLADRNAVLEAAAEVADKRESDVCRAIAAEIRALKEDL